MSNQRRKRKFALAARGLEFSCDSSQLFTFLDQTNDAIIFYLMRSPAVITNEYYQYRQSARVECNKVKMISLSESANSNEYACICESSSHYYMRAALQTNTHTHTLARALTDYILFHFNMLVSSTYTLASYYDHMCIAYLTQMCSLPGTIN